MESNKKATGRCVVWRDLSESGKPERVSYIVNNAAVVHVLKAVDDETVAYHSRRPGDEGELQGIVRLVKNLSEFEKDIIKMKTEELREKYPRIQLYEQ